MATGPEHYTEAEDWMTVADNAVGKSSEHAVMAAVMAQAHATLALAAATALTGRANRMYDLDFEAWDKVAGVQEDDEPEQAALNADEDYDPAEVDQYYDPTQAAASSEHVDYAEAEAEAVREIRELMDLDGAASWGQL